MFITSLTNPSDNDELTTSMENVLAVSLHPYTTYECAIAASTQVGLGPKGSVIYIMTKSTSTLYLHLVNVTLIHL